VTLEAKSLLSVVVGLFNSIQGGPEKILLETIDSLNRTERNTNSTHEY